MQIITTFAVQKRKKNFFFCTYKYWFDDEEKPHIAIWKCANKRLGS